MLNPDRAALLVEERRLLDDLRTTLAQLPASTEDSGLLRQAFADLDDLFMLVVAGEFNAGKSAFINALVGESFLPEGVTPTTTAINLVRYAEEPYERWVSDAVVERGYPAAWLRNLTLVDTPGTNAIIRRHEELTAHFVPRSDLVLFVTSADRPFTESERAFLERIREWGKKIVVVLNKVDQVASERELSEIVSFIAENSQRLLGVTPQIFPVSSRLAQSAKRLPLGAERAAIWQASRFAPLESYVRDALDDQERLRLKLLSPLGVADRLVARYRAQADQELLVLSEDRAAVESLERQVDLYVEDVRGDFEHRLSDLEVIVLRMADRGGRFFDETLRLGRAFDLLNADKIRGEFERMVIADTGREVEDAVREISDWLVDREQALWRSLTEYLDRRRSARPRDYLVTDASQSFENARRDLLAGLTRTARQAMASYDREFEAREMALSVRTAVAQTAMAEAGAVGLGAIVAALATTAAVDVTGILAASVVAGLGFFILPARRRRAKEEFRRKIEELRARLGTSVGEEFARALSATEEHVREAIGPYTRFVQSERERREAGRVALDRLQQELAALRQRIG
ncbi:MAG: dynamin family protein [Chloroflexota bacterium]